MSEIELIIDLHKNLKRQGPGSREETLKALSFIKMPDQVDLKVVDIGCGTGGQTITLAQNINGHITAIDIIQPFLEELNEKVIRHGLDNKVTTLNSSMDDLPFEKESIDIIWSEGAIYNIGFEKGVKMWREFLKPGGYLAVSEITWITNSRPTELEEFWNREYQEMNTASNKIKILENNGYTIAGYFYINKDSWIENYYKPLEASFSSFLSRNDHSELARQVVGEYKTEIELYMKFKEYFSYGFYVARKN